MDRARPESGAILMVRGRRERGRATSAREQWCQGQGLENSGGASGAMRVEAGRPEPGAGGRGQGYEGGVDC